MGELTSPHYVCLFLLFAASFPVEFSSDKCIYNVDKQAHRVRTLRVWSREMLGFDEGEKVNNTRCCFLCGTQGIQGKCKDPGAHTYQLLRIIFKRDI